MDLKERVIESERLSNEELEEMRTCADENDFLSHLTKYVRLRFLIDDDPIESHSIKELAERSIIRSIELSGDPAKLADLGINCAGASSATTKQLLLIIALRKGLGIRELDPDKAALAKTLPELASLLQNALREGA
ncbi:MAG: hypothetical protein E7Z99_01840 [Coriobacteriaceae bacterium]|nr:hypothetical protein [Coriobacteriaceae bacterium]